MHSPDAQTYVTLKPGSAHYYVARFAAPAEHQAVTSWLAWFAQLDQMTDNIKDPGVARLKLDWWHAEIDQLDQARHPLAQALKPWVQAPWQIKQMHRVLFGIEQHIQKKSPVNIAELTDQCDQAGASRALLLANNADAELQAQATILGRYHAVVARLQQLHHDLRHDYVSLPLVLLREPRIALDVAAVSASPDWVPTLEALLAPFEAPVLQAMPKLRREPRLHNPLRQTAQALQVVRLMRQQRFAYQQHHWKLSPIRYLWHAWRMR